MSKSERRPIKIMRDDTTPTGFTGLDVEDDKVMNKINAKYNFDTWDVMKKVAKDEAKKTGNYKELRELRNVYVKRRDTNIKACPECWDPDQPQLQLGEYPVDDPQAIRNPRPDSPEYAQSRANIIPLQPTPCAGFVGTVTVTTS